MLDVDLVVDNRLVERMNWDGSQAIEVFAQEWQRATVERSFRPTVGDSSRAAAERFLAFLSSEELHQAGDAVAVSHGGVTVDLLRSTVGDEALEERAPGLISSGVPACALTTLEEEKGGWCLRSVAWTGHLGQIPAR